MLATNAGPNQDKTWRVFRLERSAAGSDDETGSEGGVAGAMCANPRSQCGFSCFFSIACISLFWLTIVNNPSQSGSPAVVFPRGCGTNESAGDWCGGPGTRVDVVHQPVPAGF